MCCSLIQMDRWFEHVAVSLPIPVIIAQLMLIVSAMFIYFRNLLSAELAPSASSFNKSSTILISAILAMFCTDHLTYAA